ncbi:MAG: LacI family DNA-binding transcriptional regulator [Anaerolineae bacterium]
MKKGSSSVTLSDIAQAAGVSVATVSRVLHNRPDVSDQTRQRVLATIEALGYQNARHGRGTHEDVITIALLAHQMDNEYLGTILRGVTDQLEPQRHHLVVHLTFADREREAELLEACVQNGIAGVLLLTSMLTDRELYQVARGRVPMVLIDHYPDTPDMPSLRATNWQGAREAVNYLIQLGHRRIGCIVGRRGDKISDARELGYRSALIEAGLPYDASLVRPGDYTLEAGLIGGAELLERDDRPTAIFACSDYMALGVMMTAYRLGLRIPEDLSIVGFDDVPLASMLRPPLTTVRQPLYEMGRMAVQMLLSLIKGESLLSPQVELSTQLVVRESCAPPRRADIEA